MAKDNLAVKTFEYKIRKNKKFVEACEKVLLHCQQLYNACLEQRISFYRNTGLTVNWIEQNRQLTDLRAEDESSRGIPRRIQENVLRRLERSYQNFFFRVRSGKSGGFPRFRSRGRYDNFEYSIDRRHLCPLQGDKLTVAGVGTCRIRLSRPIEGAVRIVRILRRVDGFYVHLVCEQERPAPLVPTGKSVGIDVGLESFATFSTGEQIKNPRFIERAESSLIKTQKELSRKTIGSRNRVKKRISLAKKHLTVARARRHFHHRVANDLVRRFDSIFVENLNIQGMVRNHRLAKSISSVAWASFLAILTNKAAEAGRIVEKVNPNNTSQLCSSCGAVVKKKLSTRKHSCPECGLELHRDHNAAINIRSRGLAVEPEVTLALKQECS